MPTLLEQHHAILREAFARHGGIERSTQGDSFLVLFPEAPAALDAAVEAQRALRAAAWPADAEVRVRMGMHAGLAILGGDDYVGLDVHRAARIAAAAHGGQIILSDATRGLVEGQLDGGVHLLALGEHELRDFTRPEPLYQVVADGLDTAFPPLKTAGRTSHGNLPSRLTTFIGREAELEGLARLLDSNRLITLLGPGGTGKTSLSVELLRREARRFDDGAWFVALESVRDPELVPAVLAATFGLVSGSRATLESRLRAFLAPRSLGVIIDNVEQVIAAAPLLPELLRVAPGLTIVATSRAPLRVAGEQEFPVPPLPVPGAGAAIDEALANDAIRLFVDRAERVRPEYRLVAEDVDAVAEICRRLDGLPLGIEIAASRMALLPARDIADRLGRRLDLPGSGPRDAPERQRTLQAAIGWSYDLLREPEQRLLERLSVFAGGFAVDQADAICGPAEELGVDVLDGLSALVEHSLVQPAPVAASEARFQMLTTVRMFAAERLEERGDGRGHPTPPCQHLSRYRRGDRASPPGIRASRTCWTALPAEHDNLRAAFDWAIASGERGARPASRGGLVAVLAGARTHRGRLGDRATRLSRCQVPRRERAARLGLLDAAGGLAWWMGETTTADGFYQEQVDLARQLGDPRALANALFNLSHSRVVSDDPAAAQAIRTEAISRFEEIGDPRGAARVDWIECKRAHGQRPCGRYRSARETSCSGISSSTTRSMSRWPAAPWRGPCSGPGGTNDGLEHAVRSFQIAADGRDIGAAAFGIREVEIVLQRLGRPRPAAILEGAFEALCSRYGISTPPAFSEHARRLWPGPEILREELGDAEFDALSEAGARMSVDEISQVIEEAVREARPSGPVPPVRREP